MKAYNIDWDVDMEEVYEALDEMDDDEALDLLGISEEPYKNLSLSERHEYVDYLTVGAICDIHEKLFGLPVEVHIPEDVEHRYHEEGDDPEVISDWLSNEYGYCHEGFRLDPEHKTYDSVEHGDSVASEITAKMIERCPLPEAREAMKAIRDVYENAGYLPQLSDWECMDEAEKDGYIEDIPA